MGEGKLRRVSKARLPVWLRRFLSGALNFSKRIGRWPIIIWQIRGVTLADHWTLLRSALFAPVIAWKNLFEWQDPLLLSDCDVSVRNVGRFRLRARCDDLWHVLPWREKAIERYIRNSLRPGDVFIDAGANIGIYTIIAARLVGSKGKVLAVEMMPNTAARLEEHIRLNGLTNVSVIRFALSDVPGQAVTATVKQGKFGQASISNSDRIDGIEVVSVHTATLDGISEGLRKVRLMKLDLEGAEHRALLGGSSLLQKTDEIIYERLGSDKRVENPVDRRLSEFGFMLSEIDGNNRLASRLP